MTIIEEIEKNIVGHFKCFPKVLGFEVVEKAGFTIVNSGLHSSMFNIVCNTHLEEWAKHQQNANLVENAFREEEAKLPWNQVFPDAYAEALLARSHYGEDFVAQKIKEVITHFNGQPFAWWVGPSCDPKWLGDILCENGFEKPSTEYAMVYDLAKFDKLSVSSNNMVIKRVATLNQLEHFIQVIEPYDVAARTFYSRLQDERMLKGSEESFVGYEDDTPVVISSLYVEDNVAGIFNLITQENKRGRGYGTQMMKYLMYDAYKSGAKHISLLASSDSAYRIYERLGFQVLALFGCFEWQA